MADIFSKPAVNTSEEFGRSVNSVWPKVWYVINISLGKEPGPGEQRILDNSTEGLKRDFGRLFDLATGRFQIKEQKPCVSTTQGFCC